MRRLIHDLRLKYPGLDRRSKNGSRAAAIRLFYLECMGGNSAEVARCTAPECPLFEYRSGRYPKAEGAAEIAGIAPEPCAAHDEPYCECDK